MFYLWAIVAKSIWINILPVDDYSEKQLINFLPVEYHSQMQ